MKQADQLIDLMDDLFSIHSYYRITQKNAKQIRERFPGIMEYFFIGLQKKHFHQSRTPEGVAAGYSEEEINHLKKRVMEAFSERASKEPTKLVKRTFEGWCAATHPSRNPQGPSGEFMTEVGANIDDIMSNLQIYMEENFLTLPIHADQVFNGS